MLALNAAVRPQLHLRVKTFRTPQPVEREAVAVEICGWNGEADLGRARAPVVTVLAKLGCRGAAPDLALYPLSRCS